MFKKHFKPGQKVLIHLTNPEDGDDRLENISASCQAVENGILTLNLPYEIDASTFSETSKMAIISESLGLGLKAQTYFHCQQDKTSIQLRFDGDLRFFQRRPTTRLNLPIGIRYTRINGSLELVRQQWQQHIHKLANTPLEVLPQLPSGIVNLSSGGIRLGFRNAIDKAQLCMLLLQVEPETPPICTMAEVVWTHSKSQDSSCTAGLQFMAIMAEDQKRLEKFIRTCRLDMQDKKNRSQTQ
ncbi:MAG: PilZ domain-containing protein [Pedobacter sp.]